MPISRENERFAATTPTSGLAYAFQNSQFALDALITAAEERGVGKLISKPKVITQNNQKAVVKQGTKIPVQTIVNNTVSVQFVDAVLELDVIPQITADGTIYMDVDVKNDQIVLPLYRPRQTVAAVVNGRRLVPILREELLHHAA